MKNKFLPNCSNLNTNTYFSNIEEKVNLLELNIQFIRVFLIRSVKVLYKQIILI